MSTEVANTTRTSTADSADYTTSFRVPTGHTLRSTEVEKATHTIAPKKASSKVPTGHTSRSTEVENTNHISTSDSENDTISLRVPTGHTSRSTEVANTARTSIEDDNIINGIIATCIKYYKPKVMPTVDSVREILTDAYISTDENYGIEEAIEWAKGFEIPHSAVASDMRKFRAAGLNFETMVRRQISTNATNRLSKERVDILLPNNPERSKLFDLANGMVVPHCPSFVPNALGKTTPPRELYLRVHTAVDKMLFTLHEQGLAFILPEAEAIEHIPKLNLCKAHWARKKGKKSGRPIGDLSHGDGTPLNSEYAKLEAEKRWGVINHPTISDFNHDNQTLRKDDKNRFLSDVGRRHHMDYGSSRSLHTALISTRQCEPHGHDFI